MHTHTQPSQHTPASLQQQQKRELRLRTCTRSAPPVTPALFSWNVDPVMSTDDPFWGRQEAGGMGGMGWGGQGWGQAH